MATTAAWASSRPAIHLTSSVFSDSTSDLLANSRQIIISLRASADASTFALPLRLGCVGEALLRIPYFRVVIYSSESSG